MKFKGKGEINKLSLCEKSSSAGEPITELSLELHFVTVDNLELVSISEDLLNKLFCDDKTKSLGLGKGSEIRSENFNIKVDGFKFRGESFSSCEIKKQEKTGYITVLRTRVGFDEAFYAAAPGIFKKVIPIEILSQQQALPVNGQE